MWQYLMKVVITSVLVVAIAEAAKRWTLLGAVIASLPLTSILAMIWLYTDTKDIQKISALSWGIFWVVIPSLIFFALFPVFAKIGWKFWPSLAGAIACTSVGYWAYLEMLKKLGIRI